MKIIYVDNFYRYAVDDTLVAENVPEYWAPKLVELLNNRYSTFIGPTFFRAVEDSYKLHKWSPE